MSLLSAIYDILKVDTGVTNLLADGSNSLYPMMAPQNAANPCIIYHYESTPENNKDGAAKIETYELQVDVYTDEATARSTLAAEAIADEVQGALDRYSGTSASVVIDRIVYEGRQPVVHSGSDRIMFGMSVGFKVRVKI